MTETDTGINSLSELGWGSTFARQLTVEGDADRVPVRVLEVHRDQLRVAGEGVDELIGLPVLAESSDQDDMPTVGDWLLLDRESLHFGRLLERQSLFKRRAAGTSGKTQLIAANVDTVFIVASCNLDFNEARLERYLVLLTDLLTLLSPPASSRRTHLTLLVVVAPAPPPPLS